MSMFFLEGERIQIPFKAGQYRPASETPFKGRFTCGPMMAIHNTLNARLEDLLFFRGSGAVLLRNPLFLSFSGGGGPVPLRPPLDPHMIHPTYD